MHTVKLLKPSLGVLEGGFPGDIVDDEGPDGAAVIGGCDSPEPLLAGGVPHLSFDFLAVELHHLGLKLHADGGLGVVVELVSGEPGEQIGFAHGGITYDHYLEQILLPSSAFFSRHCRSWSAFFFSCLCVCVCVTVWRELRSWGKRCGRRKKVRFYY